MGRECLHLADGDLVEAHEAVALRQGHVDELGVHALDVGEDEKLFDRGVVALVAVEPGVGVARAAPNQDETSPKQWHAVISGG